MYKNFKKENPNIDMNAWANNTNYICENNEKKRFIPDQNKSRIILCKEMKDIAMTCRNHLKIENDIKKIKETERLAKEETERLAEEKKLAEKLSKKKVLKDLTLINAWNAISTNNKLDFKKITPEKLIAIANVLKDPEIHTFNVETNIYIIPDGQFDELIKKIKSNMIMSQTGLTQERIEYHKKDRTDFKAKNNKFYSPTLSKSWKKYTTWGGIKTRK